MAMEMSLMEEFVGEAREHLAIVESDFLAIEKSGVSPDAQVVNRVFRAVHTIKGGAGFLGLQKIGELSHRMETLLAIVRDGAMALNNDAIEILLDGVDRLSGMFDKVASSNDTEIEDLLERLNRQMEKDSDPKEREKLQETVNIPVPGGKEEFRFEAYNLNSIRPEHRLHMYVLSYDLNRFQESKGRSPVQLVDHLSTMGTIVDGFLSCEGIADLRQELPNKPLVYRVLYGTA
ncbi:MAG: Hpt domain-containing protein, partial [Fibrobacterota bacterium]